MNYYEIEFSDNHDENTAMWMCIKGTRQPSISEAQCFCASDSKKYGMPYQTVTSPCQSCKMKSCYKCVHRIYGICGTDCRATDDTFIENLWRENEDICWMENKDGELVLGQLWRGFPVKEFTQDDWFHWVDDHHSKGVGWVYEHISPYDF